MKIIKILSGGFFAFVALTLLIQAFKSTPPESYEKLAAFILTGGISFWLLYSSRRKENKNIKPK